MATNFEWIKLILDKWTVIVPIVLFLGTTLGWSFSSVDSSDKDIEIQANHEQIKNIANHYAQPKGCGSCSTFINQHLRTEH